MDLIQKVNKFLKKYTRIIEICNLYRERNEDAKACLDMICDIIYGEDRQTLEYKHEV